MHDDEVPIDEHIVRALIDEQFPSWRGLPVTRLATGGTVNAIFRIGDDLAARFPLRGMPVTDARSWLVSEAAAQSEFAQVSGLPTPIPVTIGSPGLGYPMPFAVQTWVSGRVPGVGEFADSDALADDVAALISRLRAAPTRGRTFLGSGRGGDLASHEGWVQECITKNAPWFDPAATSALWARLRGLPRENAHVMTHGDLIPGNVLVEHGRLVGVLDAGGFAPADPALELVAAWHLLDAPRRVRLRATLGCGDIEWQRGRAWAFVQAMGLVHYYADTNPGMHALGLRTLQEILAAN